MHRSQPVVVITRFNTARRCVQLNNWQTLLRLWVRDVKPNQSIDWSTIKRRCLIAQLVITLCVRWVTTGRTHKEILKIFAVCELWCVCCIFENTDRVTTGIACILEKNYLAVMKLVCMSPLHPIRTLFNFSTLFNSSCTICLSEKIYLYGTVLCCTIDTP